MEIVDDEGKTGRNTGSFAGDGRGRLVYKYRPGSETSRGSQGVPTQDSAYRQVKARLAIYTPVSRSRVRVVLRAAMRTPYPARKHLASSEGGIHPVNFAGVLPQ